MKLSSKIVALTASVVAWSAGVGIAATPYRAIDVKEGGTITGVVRLAGPAPKRVVFETGKDPDWCGTSKVSPRLVLGRNNGVANTVIALQGVTQGKKFVKTGPFVLDQRKCEYVPHILVVPVGADFDIVNSDAILHNVHTYSEGGQPRTIFNIAQPVKGFRFPVKAGRLPAPGTYYATCDAGHPWMSAYVVVAPHPYVAVTDADGRFTMDNVPPRKYTITMWHEGVAVTRTDRQKGKVTAYHYESPYEDSQQVTVSANGRATVEFVLTLRSEVYAQR